LFLFDLFFSTEAVVAAPVTGTVWLMVAVLMGFILPDFIQVVLGISISLIFIIVFFQT